MTVSASTSAYTETWSSPDHLAAFTVASRAASSSARKRFVQLAIPHHHHLHGDAVIGLHLSLQQADPLGQHGGVLPDGARGPALEEPGAQLALLGPGEAHDLLGIVGRTLNERQRLERRVVDVGRHLRPLLGQRTRLAFGDEVPHEAEPPGAEDDDARRDDQGGAANGPERGHRGVALDQQGDAARSDENAGDDASDEPAPARPVVRVRTEQGQDVIVDERLLRLVGVAPDEDHHADGQERRPAEEPDEPDVQGAGDELHRDQQRDEDGGDRPDPPAVADGA